MEEVYYGMPDADHIAMGFDAISDTLDRMTGNESLKLTKAQIYVHAILAADGTLTRVEAVAGNESFFGAIGNGIKGLWEFIVKIFTGIWRFLFGSSDDSLEKKEKEAIDAVEANAAKMKAEEEARKKAEKQEREEGKEKERAAAKKHDEEEEAYRAKAGERKVQLSNLVEKAQRTSAKLTALSDISEEGKMKDTPFEQLHNEVMMALITMSHTSRDSVLRKADDAHSFIKALDVQYQIKIYLEKMKAGRAPIEKIKNQVKSAVDKLGQQVKNVDTKTLGGSIMKHDLDAAKGFLQLLAHISKVLEDNIEDCVKISNWLKVNYNQF